MRGAFAAHVPMIGICFGHQLIAQALGGRVVKFDGGWSVGVRGRTASTDDAGLPGLDGRSLAVAAYHQDQVVEPPPGARTVASSDFCRHAALVYGARALTVQPHPEFDEGFLAGLVATRGDALPADARDPRRGLARAAAGARARVGEALARVPAATALDRRATDPVVSARDRPAPADASHWTDALERLGAPPGSTGAASTSSSASCRTWPAPRAARP